MTVEYRRVERIHLQPGMLIQSFITSGMSRNSHNFNAISGGRSVILRVELFCA